MIDITLIEPTVAIVEERYHLDRAWAYTTNMNLIRHAMAPGSVGGIGVPGFPSDNPTPGIKEDTYHLWLTPDGLARMEHTWSFPYHDPMRMSEIVTASERLSWMPSNLPPEAHPEQRIQRRPHDPRPSHRQSEDFFGWNYPIQALAILNPMLMMFDYVAQVGSERRTEHLGRTTKTRRLDHHPERPINATDDPERLGSFHVEVAITDDDPPMVLEWSALHAGEPFSTTRVTWMRQGIDLDPAIFTDPRIPAPSLPVD